MSHELENENAQLPNMGKPDIGRGKLMAALVACWAVMFLYDANRYVMPDALSTSLGTTIGGLLSSLVVLAFVVVVHKIRPGVKSPIRFRLIIAATTALTVTSVLFTALVSER
jgi:hypothetical protein